MKHKNSMGGIAATLLSVILLALFSCGRSPKIESEQTEVYPINEVTLSADQVKTGEIIFGQIVRETLSNDVKTKGKLVVPPQMNASVGSMISGTIEKILVTEGMQVSRGQTLAILISPEIINLQQEYLSSKGKLDYLQQEFERQKILNENKINSDKKFQEATNELLDIDARFKALTIQLELLNIPVPAVDGGKIQRWAPIVAPINGSLEQVHVMIGEFVEPKTNLFRIVDKSRLFIELMVFEKDIPFIRIGQRVTFTLANLGREHYEAHVLAIGKTVEENARTVKILAEFRNTSPYILPGMFVAAEIHTYEQEVDALPEESVVTETGKDPYVFYTVSQPGDSLVVFTKVSVKTGFHEDGFIQVEPLTPIPEYARIVIKGSYYIKAEGIRQME